MDYIVNDGDSDIGLESTVVRVVNDEIKILRPGKITKEDMEKIVRKVDIDKKVMAKVAKNEKVLSPGMKYRHYAPKTHCKLVYSSNNKKLVNEILNLASETKNVVILATSENIDEFREYKTIDIGSKNNLQEISHNIFQY